MQVKEYLFDLLCELCRKRWFVTKQMIKLLFIDELAVL